MGDDRQSDNKKFAYHEGARIIRMVHTQLCERTHTGTPLSRDECESLCDMLIELHSLLYSVTLHTFREDGPEGDQSYQTDEIYSDGRPVVSRALLPVDPTDDSIPSKAWLGSIGEDVPRGGVIHVWRPGDTQNAVLAGDQASEVAEMGASSVIWKGFADLRASGFIDWVRRPDGHIDKRPGADGRPQPVCAITAAGKSEHDRLMKILSEEEEFRSDGAEALGATDGGNSP